MPDGAGFRAARKAGGARYAAFLCALSLRATTFVCFFGAARATATRDPVGALALCLAIYFVVFWLPFREDIYERILGKKKEEDWGAVLVKKCRNSD